MTATIVIEPCPYQYFKEIRRTLLDADPTILTYENYDSEKDGSFSRGILTFREPALIPKELERFRLLLPGTEPLLFTAEALGYLNELDPVV